ncbi:MAG: hypothetical protein ACLP01_09240 [Solirubrobacteraceae bacterium]
MSKVVLAAAVAFMSVVVLAPTANAGAGVRSCGLVRVSTDGGKAVFEATSITARGVPCGTARELAGKVGHHVLLAANPPGGKYDACMLTTRMCSAMGFMCRGRSMTRRPYALTERCTHGGALVRWRELDFDYR